MVVLEYLFAFVVLLSILIFVHELGHFTVAKLCGVRVLKFCMGFGNPIGFGRYRLRWKRGHTEYVIAWFPLGGFVKMLGEYPGEEESDEVRATPGEALNHKPTWQKLAIVFAGPAMNLALPVVIFVGTLWIGMPRPEAVVGLVERGSPAAEVGLEPGDRVLSVAGQPVTWWDQVDDRIRENAGAPIEIRFERGDEPGSVTLAVGARSGLDEFGDVRDVGWAGLGHRRHRAVLGIPSAESPAGGSDLRSGDIVTDVDGEPVADWHAFGNVYAAATGPEVTLTVTRGPVDAPETTHVVVPAVGSVSALGVLTANVLVSSVSPDSAAERAGLEVRDLILAVDGEPVGSFTSFADIVRTSGGRTLHIVIARGGARREIDVTPALVSTDVGMGIEEPRYLVGIAAEPTVMLGALATDRERNPLVAIPRAVGMTVDVTQLFLRGLGKLVTGQVSRKQLAGPIGIAQIAGESMKRGWETFLSTLILISINLGILNLLPIPILDGGQALIFIIEAAKRGPISLRTREIVQQVGLTVLVLLMGMAFWNDLSRHWGTVVDWLRGGTGL